MTDNREREKFYYNYYVHKGFISAVSLIDDLMKILIFYHVILKDLGSDCYCKNNIPK